MGDTQQKFTRLLAERLAGAKMDLVQDSSYANTGSWRAERPASFEGSGRHIMYDFQASSVKLVGIDPTSPRAGATKYVELRKAGVAEKLQEALLWAESFLLEEA